MRSQTTKVDKISKLNESFEIQPQKSTQLESLDPIVYSEVTSPFPPIINNEKINIMHLLIIHINIRLILIVIVHLILIY